MMLQKLMKELNKVDTIRIAGSKLYFDKREIDLAQSIPSLANNKDLPGKYKSEQFMPSFPEWLVYSFDEYNGIFFYTKNEIIEKLAIALMVPNNDGCFSGEIIVNGQIIPNPLYATDAKNFFPRLELHKAPSTYKDDFTPHYSNQYLLDEKLELEIVTNRDGKYIGVINIKPC